MCVCVCVLPLLRVYICSACFRLLSEALRIKVSEGTGREGVGVGVSFNYCCF